MPERRAPIRTCIACRTTSDKRELIRVVRTPSGSVEVDLSSKKPGRGAYLCPRVDCWSTALKKNRLDTALKTTLRPDDKLHLTQFATTLEQAVAI